MQGSPLDPDAVIRLVVALRDAGIRRFSWGDLSFDFADRFADGAPETERDTMPAGPEDAVISAALRLANRGRSAA